MENQIKILDLLNQKQNKQVELETLIYGSIEIREKDNKQYIYTHNREDGMQSTKYIGEYSEDLYNLILNNNIKAKELKKDIRRIEKELKELNYVDEDLTIEVTNNIDYARKHLADTIYKQAILEGVATTLSDTENIIEGGKVNNMSSEDILKIINLKHAWEFILNKNVITSKTNYSILCMINRLVEEGFYYNAGIIRNVPVNIGGTSWKPDIPVEADIKDEINNIVESELDDIDKSIRILLYVVKKQIFIDGNKRTSVVFANHYLISKGKGLIVIPSDKVEKYKKLLVDYYESNNDKKISEFLKKECFLNIE
ncbi:MAG: Fic family protein [Bacilli bacterium]|nr:Fic family protein [Bacilli bacterium]